MLASDQLAPSNNTLALVLLALPRQIGRRLPVRPGLPLVLSYDPLV